MSDKSTAASGGIGFGGLLTILFIALKLTHVINWSWWWVLSPLWIGPLCLIAFLVVAGIVMLAGAIIVAILDR